MGEALTEWLCSFTRLTGATQAQLFVWITACQETWLGRALLQCGGHVSNA